MTSKKNVPPRPIKIRIRTGIRAGRIAMNHNAAKRTRA